MFGNIRVSNGSFIDDGQTRNVRDQHDMTVAIAEENVDLGDRVATLEERNAALAAHLAAVEQRLYGSTALPVASP